jgi:hypothetical protein
MPVQTTAGAPQQAGPVFEHSSPSCGPVHVLVQSAHMPFTQQLQQSESTVQVAVLARHEVPQRRVPAGSAGLLDGAQIPPQQMSPKAHS